MKKGFTLIELLAVISIIGLLTLITLPKIIDLFNESSVKAMKVFEREVLDAGNLYVEDYCRNPIDDNYRQQCIDERRMTDDEKVYFCLSTLQSKKIIDGVVFDGSIPCVGMVIYDYEDSKNRHYNNGKAYLICGEDINSDDVDYYTEGLEEYADYITDCLE